MGPPNNSLQPTVYSLAAVELKRSSTREARERYRVAGGFSSPTTWRCGSARYAEACRVDNWEFNEWLHGRTGQSWNAALFVHAYQALVDDGSESAEGRKNVAL